MRQLLCSLGIFSCMLFMVFSALGQNGQTIVEFIPKSYIVHFAEGPILIDGSLNDKAWENAPWTDLFEDITGYKSVAFPTRVKMLWNNDYLFIGAKLEEENVWASIRKKDSIIYLNNDFEVFLSNSNSTRNYTEIEINALNSLLDIFIPKPYRNGGKALISWDIKKLQSAVSIQGTLNNPKDKDSSWTVEVAIPFKSLSLWAVQFEPANNSLWRINFSRVEWDFDLKNGLYEKRKDAAGKLLPEHNFVWSPQGIVDMHFPERWGYLSFTTDKNKTNFIIPYTELQKLKLWHIYYLEKKYYSLHKEYAKSMHRLSTKDNVLINTKRNRIQLIATKKQFTAIISDLENQSIYSINDAGIVENMGKPKN
ncbi:carbohydrate-binding family 9-like protein [Arachidicoccus sp.]|uniref:carbohydrate-binding family 9-like protein n=1 Tax=Arachidicoccus sp. TaxID=1872624 RepID=UPI003D1D7A39